MLILWLQTDIDMRRLKKENEKISTVLAFSIIPISGFAMDVFVPSFPQMVQSLHTTPDSIRLILTIFLISYGISQLFVGSIVDTFGRYRIAIASLFVFVLTNIVIALTHSMPLIYVMRGVQGFVVSLIMVAKRSFFVDVYSGTKQKHYTSLLSIVWSAAPVIAPFLGGYLQHYFGWQANFVFLALYGFLVMLMELIFGGETIPAFKPFHPKTILNVYKEFLSAKDFSFGIIFLGVSYAMVIVYGMSAPFIIEQVFHYSPVATGYASLCSGIAMMFGGLLSKALISKPFYKKLRTGSLIQFAVAVLMFIAGASYFTIYFMMLFIVVLHFLMGFLYNIYFTYCLTRFSSYAGTAGGITSGGSYVFTSLMSFIIVSIINIHDQQSLAISYITLTIILGIVLLGVRKAAVVY